MHQKAGPRVHRITGAPRSLKADIRSREVRYLLSMGVRTVCFVLAFVTEGVLRWLLIVAAFLLPYVAVVIANAGRDTRKASPAAFLPPSGRQLPSGPGTDQGRNSGESV